VTFQRESLSKAEFTCFHDLGFVAVFDDGARRAFANHPEVVGGDVEWDAACGAGAGAAGGERCGEGLVAGILEVKAVATEELVA
jgi:hypothetical protein